MFESRLLIISEPNNRYSLLAKTRIPGNCFMAGEVIKEAPGGVKVGKHVRPLQLHLKYRNIGNVEFSREVRHQVFNLDLIDGEILKVFVILDDIPVSSTETLIGITPIDGTLVALEFLKSEFGLPRPILTPALCQGIIIRSTPAPWNYLYSTQLLSQLGIVDKIQANAHRTEIFQQMNRIGYKVHMPAIISGTNISVVNCRDSLLNAKRMC